MEQQSLITIPLTHTPNCRCPVCGEPFWRKPSYVVRGINKYCSKKCRYSRTLEDRFWEKVTKGDGCWGWTGATQKGYGCLFVMLPEGRSIVRAHRLSWEIHNGPILNDLCVLHRCDNRLCCNPAHLFLGTKLDNVRDAIQKGRHRMPDGSCPPVKERDVNLDNESVKTYRRICHLQANYLQREEIALVVTNERIWEVVLLEWMLEGRNPKNVLGMLKVYQSMNGGREL